MMTDPLRIVSKLYNNRFASEREKRFMTRREFAEYVGVSYGLYCQVEAMSYRPSERTQRKIADRLGLSVEWLWPPYLSKIEKTRATRTIPEAEILQLEAEPTLLQLPSGEEDPEDLLFRQETREAIQRALSELTPREQMVVRMSFLGELSVSEIASRFQLSRHRIYQILAKALRKLRHPSISRRLRKFLERPRPVGM